MHISALYMEEKWNWPRFARGVAAGASIGLGAMAASLPAEKPTSSDEIPITAPEKPSRVEPSQSAGARAFNYSDFRERLQAYEGYRLRRYQVQPGEVAIGIGHTMQNPTSSNPTAASRRVFRQVFGDAVNFDRVLAGQALTDAQVASLADHDIDEHLGRARRIFPQFGSYPEYVQFALLDSVYRGDTGRQTARLINAGRWEEAAVEYLNRHDYRNAESLGISGIRSRMEHNRDAMVGYGTDQNR